MISNVREKKILKGEKRSNEGERKALTGSILVFFSK